MRTTLNSLVCGHPPQVTAGRRASSPRGLRSNLKLSWLCRRLGPGLGSLGLTLALALALTWGCSKPEPGPLDGPPAADLAPPSADLTPPGPRCQYEPAPIPAGVGQPIAAGAVLAGVGEAPLDLPVGTPLGGYTARMKLLGGTAPDSRQSPHAKAFVASAGVQTRPQVRALYLQAGSEPVLMVKADLCVAYDRLVYDLERELLTRGLMSSRGRVIVSTSHTHGGYGTFQGTFHLALGFDLFQEEQYQRLLRSMVAAAAEAIKKAAPASIGVGVWDGWDSKDEIYSDRRGEDNVLKGPDGKPIGPHKEQRLLVVRVDDGAGQPLALLTSFPMHGTIGGEDNPLTTTDSTGHVELSLEEQFDRKVLVMHLQGPAGDASPRGRGGLGSCDDKQTLCTDFGRMESVGQLAAPRIFSLWQAIKTTSTTALEVVTRAVPNGRDIRVRDGLAYAPYEPDRLIDNRPEAIFNPDGTAKAPITQFNVPVGAGLCGSKSPMLPVDGIPGAKGLPYGSCAEMGAANGFISTILQLEAPPVPTCETTRTTLTALRLGAVPVLRRKLDGGGVPVDEQAPETLLLVTLPGEPVSLLADALRKKSPAGAEQTFVIGYSQGHVGYILGVENWLLGGYEPSINIYGPLEGEWLMERALDLAKLAMTPERDDAEATGPGAPQPGGRFDRYVFPPGKPANLPPTGAAKAGQVPGTLPAELFVRTRATPPTTAQPAPTVARLSGRASFVFYGGDPEEGTPEVTLQREEPAGSGTWTPVTTRSGRVLGSRGREVLLTYTPQPLEAMAGQIDAHLWAAEWQAVGWERAADRTGVAAVFDAPLGRYRFAVQGSAGGKAYAVQSSPFALSADGVVRLAGSRSGGKLTGQAVYPIGAGYRLLRLDGPSDGDVPVAGSAVLSLRSLKDNKTETLPAALAGGQWTVTTTLDVSAGVEVALTDSYGNRSQKLTL